MENSSKKIFGARLRELRKANKVSQRELGRALGLSDMAISRYETGTAIPSMDTAMQIVKYFGTTFDYLLGHIDNSDSNSEEAIESGAKLQHMIDVNKFNDTLFRTDKNIVLQALITYTYTLDIDELHSLKRTIDSALDFKQNKTAHD